MARIVMPAYERTTYPLVYVKANDGTVEDGARNAIEGACFACFIDMMD